MPKPLVYLLVLVALGPELSRAKDEAYVVEALQKSYDSITDFVADFRQETELRALQKTLRSRGKVYLKRPGKMLWKYEAPKEHFVLADGKHLYFYQPEQAQVIKSPLRQAFRSDVPVSFLLGLGNLKKDFATKLKGMDDGRYVLRLASKSDLEGVGEIELGIEPQSFDIAWARVKDAAGNTTTVRFSKLRKGVGLGDAFFRLEVPPGVDIVELGK